MNLQDLADGQVLVAALGGQVDLIVPGESDLLVPKHFMGIDGVTSALAIERLGLSAWRSISRQRNSDLQQHGRRFLGQGLNCTGPS
jgi:hypothetical protein